MYASRRPLFSFATVLLSLFATAVHAQTVDPTDDSTLKQIILFGRHGVRSAALPYSAIQGYASQPYPDFGVPTGYLTVHGYQAQQVLGSYFRDYLLHERLLTGSAETDVKRSYFRANSIQRSNLSATALGAGMIPGVTIPVHSFPLGTPDAIFDPISAKLVTKIDTDRAVAEARGVFYSGSALQSAFASELALIRSALFRYPFGTPPPATPPGLVDPTALPIPLTASTNLATSNVINAGGLFTSLYAADPFVMEYTSGLPLDQVAWGQLSLDQISQQTRIITLLFSLEVTPPYLNRLQSSNAASHILRTMKQAVVNETIPGAFGSKSSKIVVINSSDAFVAGLAGLMHAHWLLPGYQPDYCAPGGNLVFELRESRKTGEDFVRIWYTAQTFDQLRDLTALTLDQPPATQQLLLPEGKSDANLDIAFDDFEKLMTKAIGQKFVQNPSTEIHPGVLANLPLQ